MTDINLHQKQKGDRNECTRLILDSRTKNKIIVAGPGTGKSFTFQELLKTKGRNGLALTFTNNLAQDLEKDLGTLAKSYTFHGYCKKLLHRISVDGIDTDFLYYPKLSKLIKSDAIIIGNTLEKFDEAFHILARDSRIEFYLECANYYNAVGHNDAVYRVLKYFQTKKDSLPSFSQIVVDEYQDFNQLEVAFIDELAKTSPILIVGDDDQAIYNFKNASPDHIRTKFIHADFEKFELPYCSRCTEVIISSVHDVIKKAKSIGKLQNRIEKNYICFLPDKETDNIKHPQIIHAKCSVQNSRTPYISKFIEQEIKKIPQIEINCAREKGFPCVLIAGPSHYTKQVYDYLLENNFKNIDYVGTKKQNVEFLEGYEVLMHNRNSNLGWRIILECSRLTDKTDIIKMMNGSKQKLTDLLSPDFKEKHLAVVALLAKLKLNETLLESEIQKLLSECGKQKIQEIKEFLNINLETENDEETIEDTNISIKITTISGSKGLSANYVFLIGMNNNDFPKNDQNPTDNEICQFIVGITRTRKKCYLISNFRFAGASRKSKSVFIDWIKTEKVAEVNVSASFFQNPAR